MQHNVNTLPPAHLFGTLSMQPFKQTQTHLHLCVYVRQVQSLADRSVRDAKVERLKGRCAMLEVRRQTLKQQRASAQQELQANGDAEDGSAAGQQGESSRQALVDLDDQLDATDEELSFLEGELSTAERASSKGESHAALELRRCIAGGLCCVLFLYPNQCD